MLKIAHRGYSQYNEDNTLEAFEQALKHGFTMIELDIQLDKNKELIAFHDVSIGDKRVKDMTFAEILQIRPNTLSIDQFFTRFDYQSIMLYFDLKGDAEVVPYLLDYIRTYKINTSRIWFASFNFEHLDLLYKDSTEHKLGLITDNCFSCAMLNEIIKKYQLKFICFHWTALNHKSIEFIHSQHVNVFLYTVTSKHIVKLTSDYHIDGMVSDIKI
jgi:glycerophosphoryl diester phosphodiesterase